MKKYITPEFKWKNLRSIRPFAGSVEFTTSIMGMDTTSSDEDW